MSDDEQRDEEVSAGPDEPSGDDPSGDDPSGEEDSKQPTDADAAEATGSDDAPAAKQDSKAFEKAVATVAHKPSFVFLLVVTIVNLVADLWSKGWAMGHFESLRPGDPRRVVIIEDHLNFIFAKNRGGAWGLLQNETESLRRPFFLIVSVAAIVFIVSLYRKLQEGQTALKWGLPLVLGGALGNLVDRVRYGYVVDFIDVYMQMDGRPKHWPTFNVADISICIGVGLMAIDMFTSREPAKPPDEDAKKAEAADAPPPSDHAPPPAEEVMVKKDDADSEPKAEKAAGEGA